MKAKCKVRALRQGLDMVSGTVGRSTLPVLQGVKVSALEGSLQLSTSNLEMFTQTTVQAEVEPGASPVLVAAKRLRDIVKSLPGDEVSLDTTEQFLAVQSGQTRFRLRLMDVFEFPARDDGLDMQFSVDAEVLLVALKAVEFCANPDDSRPVCAGVLFEGADNGMLSLVATDIRRLSYGWLDVGKAMAHYKVVLPVQFVRQVLRAFKDDPADTVVISSGDTVVKFSGANVVVGTQVLETQYPDYGRLFDNAQHSTSFECNASACADIVKRVRLVAPDSIPIIKLEITGDGDQWVLTAVSDNAEVGNASDQVAVDAQAPMPAIGVNATFAAQVLEHITTERVRVSYAGPTDVLLVEPVGMDVRYLLMPMKLD